MPTRRPYSEIQDHSQSFPLGNQLDHPLTGEFIPTAARNRRSIVGGDGNTYVIADQSVSPRNTKSIVWSSEGYTSSGIAIPALTSTQKKASGSVTTNITAASTSLSNLGLSTTSIDVSPYRSLTILLAVTALTGTSIQFELDLLDDLPTPTVLPIWKPAAITAAPNNLYLAFGLDLYTPVAAAAGSMPTGFGATTVPANWTYYALGFPLTPQVNFAWTATSLTAASWTAFIYGSY